MCKVYTGHVQEIIMRGNPVMTLFLTVLIDNYDSNTVTGINSLSLPPRYEVVLDM